MLAACTDALERDWITATDPVQLATILERAGVFSHRGAARKVRLFALACCRGTLAADADPRAHLACQLGELHAYGGALDEDLVEGQMAAALASKSVPAVSVHCWAAVLAGIACRPDLVACVDTIRAITVAAGGEHGIDARVKAAWLRDLFGPIFRLGEDNETKGWLARDLGSNYSRFAWNENPARRQAWRVAREIHAGRTYAEPMMERLANALRLAGCDDAEILRHLRGWERCALCLGSRHKELVATGAAHMSMAALESGAALELVRRDCPQCLGFGWVAVQPTHVRGCWVIDLLLGF